MLDMDGAEMTAILLSSTYIPAGSMYRQLYEAELGIINVLPFYNISQQQKAFFNNWYNSKLTQ